SHVQPFPYRVIGNIATRRPGQLGFGNEVEGGAAAQEIDELWEEITWKWNSQSGRGAHPELPVRESKVEKFLFPFGDRCRYRTHFAYDPIGRSAPLGVDFVRSDDFSGLFEVDDAIHILWRAVEPRQLQPGEIAADDAR